MNLVKQKELLVIAKELSGVELAFQQKKKAFLDAHVPPFLEKGLNAIVEHLENEEFTVTEYSPGQYKADYHGNIVISIDKKPTILSIAMPNGERYAVKAESNLDRSGSFTGTGPTSEDREISTMKKKIEFYKNKIITINDTKLYYQLLIENERPGQYNQQRFDDFAEILTIMFK